MQLFLYQMTFCILFRLWLSINGLNLFVTSQRAQIRFSIRLPAATACLNCNSQFALNKFNTTVNLNLKLITI